jgi:hypothetical protein
MERQAQPPSDAREWAAAEVPKALAPMGAPRRTRPVGRLAQVDESALAKQPPAARTAWRRAARQLEAQQKSMVILAEPMRAQQATRVLRRSELPQAAAPLQEPWPLVVPRPAAQRRALR